SSPPATLPLSLHDALPISPMPISDKKLGNPIEPIIFILFASKDILTNLRPDPFLKKWRAYTKAPTPVAMVVAIAAPFTSHCKMRSEEHRLNSSHVSISYAV